MTTNILLYMKVYFSLYKMSTIKIFIFIIHQSVFLLYKTIYNENIYLSLYKKTYNDNKNFSL